jgi:integrase
MLKTIHLTKVNVDALPFATGNSYDEYVSAEDKRHRVLVGKKTKTFAVRMNVNNKRHCKTLGHFPDMSITAFKREAPKNIADIFSGNCTSDKCITMKTYLHDEFLPHSKLTHKDHYNVWNRSKRIVEYFGSMNLSDITIHDAKGFRSQLIAEGLKPATVNRYMALLSRMFSYAIELGLVEHHPCRNIKKILENNIRTRILSLLEIQALLTALENEPNQVLAESIGLTLFTGMRIGEVTSLHTSMLSDDLSTILLPDTKSGRPHTVHLNERAKNIIKHRVAAVGSGYLFPSTSKGVDHISRPKSAFQRIKQSMADQGALEGHFTLHDLRRTYCSYLLTASNDIRLVQQCMGHSSVSVTERYSHHQAPRIAKASTMAEHALLGMELTND